MRSLLLLLLATLAACSGAMAQPQYSPDPDTIAKFLAGLAVPAAPVDATTMERPGGPAPDPSPFTNPESPWIIHSNELDRAWKHTQEAQLATIANWAPSALGSAYRDTGTMFYMFSGPDFLYAHAFFPEARTYVLCGNEPVGAVPNLNKVPAEVLPAALANIRKSLESVLNWSFFITKNMKNDLTQPQLNGTLPLLYVFLARAGYNIDTVRLVTIDRTGTVIENENGETPGVRIVFTKSPDSPQHTLYYFCSDLSDEGVKNKPGFLRFCEREGRGVSLLKAASYLMHEPGFSHVREFLLGHSDTILQDDSGIPFHYFEPNKWTLHYWGPYAGPIDVFKKYWQPDLANEWTHNASAPLRFGFGYQWQPTRSGLMIATSTETTLTQVQQ
jgi:hypothetical protein